MWRTWPDGSVDRQPLPDAVGAEPGPDADADADAEQAGRSAALQVFGELDAVVLFSEADTIKALLARARAK